jgi:tetratricopeptide (TPR) repeat protein
MTRRPVSRVEAKDPAATGRWCRPRPAVGEVFRRIPVSLILCFACTFLAAQDEINRARRELDSNRPEEAISLLESYRRSHPSDPEAYNLLGVAYGRSGDDDRSLEMFQQLSRLAPNQPEVYNNLGAAYLRKERLTEAVNAFGRALRLNPNDVNALYNLGALLNSAHKYKESRPLLERALGIERSSPVAYETAVALAGSGDRKAALKVLDSVPAPVGDAAVPWLRLTGTINLDDGNLGPATTALEQARALAPDDKESAYALAMVRLKSNQADLALSLLEVALKSLPQAARLIREGTVLASYGAYPQALSVFEQAVKERPDSYDAQYNLAVVRLEHFKNASSALEAAQHALEVKDTAELEDLLGDICEAQGQYVDALKHYQQAARLDPNDERYAFDLGAELIAHENYDAARSVFHAARERFPRSARIHLGAGTAEFLRGKTEAAVDAYLKAVELGPDYEPGLLFLGEAFSFSENKSAEVVAKLKEFATKRPESFGAQYYYGAALVKGIANELSPESEKQAFSALRHANRLKPQDARVYYQLGELFRLQKKFPDAAEQLQKSISLDPNYPEPLYKLGQVYQRMGKQDEAKRAFARHRDVLAKTEADLYHRASEIQSFVLTMRSSPERGKSADITR